MFHLSTTGSRNGQDRKRGTMKKSVTQRLNKKTVTKAGGPNTGIEFLKIPKPAQRALLNNGIHNIADLSKRTFEEVKEFHGIGSSAFPILKQALQKNGLTFKKS